MVKPTFAACHNTEEKSSPSSRYLRSISEVMAFCWTLWSSVSKCSTQWAQIFRIPKLPIISWTALCSIPSFVAIMSSVTRLSSLMISSPLFLLGSVEAVQGRLLRGWSWMLVFPSLKCCTHRLTLLAPTHTSPYTRWSLWWISAAVISSLTRNSMTTRWRNDMNVFYLAGQKLEFDS